MIPTLILAFQRKDQVEKLIRIAADQHTERIYVSIDGPRSSSEAETQSKIIEMIDSLRLELEVEIIARQMITNAGPGAAVISGIDWFFERENAGLIFEDDLLPEPGFFHAAEGFLERSDLDERILMISGTNVFDLRSTNVQLIRYPVVWGWATTRSKWLVMKKLIFSSPSELSLRKLGVQYFYWRLGKKRALEGKTKVWDVPLSGAMFSQGYFCALTPTNMVSNIGFDLFASNTTRNQWPLNIPTSENFENFQSISITSKNIKSLEKFMRKNIFNFGVKYFLSSLFWNIIEAFPYRENDPAQLENELSKITWRVV